MENSSAKPLGRKVCPGCGTINEASSVYCYNCGVALPPQVIPSAEAVGNPAGFWVRTAAFIIDNILVTVFVVLVVTLLLGVQASEVWTELTRYEGSWRTTITSEALSVAYFTFAIGKWGQTLGKAMLGLKVSRKDGSRLTYWRSFARYWSYYLSAIPLFLGFLFIALTSKKRGLHDYVCDSKVVKVVR